MLENELKLSVRPSIFLSQKVWEEWEEFLLHELILESKYRPEFEKIGEIQPKYRQITLKVLKNSPKRS